MWGGAECCFDESYRGAVPSHDLQKHVDYAAYNNNPKQKRTCVDKYWVFYVDIIHQLKIGN
jgi:hypothetical protein